MEVIMPKLGLFVWALVIFLIFFFLLKKFAWKPILEALKKREEGIENSLQEAQKARDEMQNLKSENEKILREARAEREVILKEAREMKESMINEARTEAKEEADRIMAQTRDEIQSEKMRAITEIKNQVGMLSLQIAEKLLRKELADKDQKQAVVDQMIDDLHLN
ncbi:MAG: F0F1 ATP synthase subunit B [Bacteroidia bacterium]|nr:F0F1 ATP synthase subunit B [Bacteroidia bacterium]